MKSKESSKEGFVSYMLRRKYRQWEPLQRERFDTEEDRERTCSILDKAANVLLLSGVLVIASVLVWVSLDFFSESIVSPEEGPRLENSSES